MFDGKLRESRWIVLSLAVVFILIFLTPLFSYELVGSEEPLEKLAEACNAAEVSIYRAPLPDYSAPGIGNEVISGYVAGIAGFIAVLAFAFGLGCILKWLRRRED